MNNIFLPKQLTVGFQGGRDTYTGQLAYIIYTDEKGVLRKEKSWNSWRDKSIEPLIVDNVPTSGFVLNKKAGGYATGWNHRQTYVRVYDPRGFEFEISIPNLLYILEHTNSIKGKGLDGEFIYGWDGTELLLMPTSSSDYESSSKYSKILYNNKTIKVKDLKIGAIYKTKENKELIYMGKFDYYDYHTKSGKRYFFCEICEDRYYFYTMTSLNSKLIEVIDENCVNNYSEIFERLEHDSHYSPIDDSKDEYIDYTSEELKEKLSNRRYYYFYSNKINGEMVRYEISFFNNIYEVKELHRYDAYFREQIEKFDSFEEFFEEYEPKYVNKYLANGNLYKKGN